LPFHFGGFVLDPERRELRAGDKVLAVEPQVFDLLEFLIRSRERVVSRDDVLAAVWGGRIVSDSAIAARINAARRVIGDDGTQQRYIRTIARKGFRFVGEVWEGAATATAGPPPEWSVARSSTRDRQRLTFCRTSDGVSIAVARIGHGMPLVCTPTLGASVEYDWESPVRAGLWPFLADRFELIRYDARGTGLSDRKIAGLSLATMQRDLDAVVDALGLEHYALFGVDSNGAPAIAHAAHHPERVSKLVIHGGIVRGHWIGNVTRLVTGFVGVLGEDWGAGARGVARTLFPEVFPGMSPQQVDLCLDLLTRTTSLENTLRLYAAIPDFDVSDLLPQVRAPTLVLHCRDCRLMPVEYARHIATAIPNARLVSLETANIFPLPGEPAWPVFLNTIETFLTEA
jgi:DNA-binding winged helix-turn-helix (wHTH) protein/pimeloyl-ACP methyl ester carboxylesterase